MLCNALFLPCFCFPAIFSYFDILLKAFEVLVSLKMFSVCFGP